jgi:hypothetical protein
VLTFAVVGLVACSDDDEGPDVVGACREVCTNSAFGSSRLDEKDNETNCFCSAAATGAAGNVSEATCQNMCNKIGRPKASTFTQGVGGTKDACQCSP